MGDGAANRHWRHNTVHSVLQTLPISIHQKYGCHHERPCDPKRIDVPLAIGKRRFANFRVYLLACFGAHSKNVVMSFCDFTVYSIATQAEGSSQEYAKINEAKHNYPSAYFYYGGVVVHRVRVFCFVGLIIRRWQRWSRGILAVVHQPIVYASPHLRGMPKSGTLPLVVVTPPGLAGSEGSWSGGGSSW